MHSDQTGNYSLTGEVDHFGARRDFTGEPDLSMVDHNQPILARGSAGSVD
jgi:hypothetical protein